MARKEGSILIVDDNNDLLIALRLILSRTFTTIDTLKNPNLILSTLEKQAYDIILLDMNFKAGQNTGNEGIFWMNKILEKDPEATVVFITAYGDVELATKSMKEGAVDFIMKSWDEQKILSTLQSAFELRKSKMQVSLLKKKQAHLSAELEKDHSVCYCHSSSMKDLDKLISKVASTDASVLILGENGTGKEVVARDIHRLSARKNEIFMKVDLGALPETLFESELFGHVKGAFTDAKEERDGRFVIASGGTLFLDEIGNLPVTLQTKLLTVLEQRGIHRIGSGKQIPINIRLISATNQPVQQMVEKGTFRQDLLYRLNTIELLVPPLRERTDDIPLLANHFLEEATRKYGKSGLEISKKSMKQLQQYNWPGNVRELQNTLARAVIMSDYKQVKFYLLGSTGSELSAQPSLNIEDNEKLLIRKALLTNRGNVTKAAFDLGLDRNALYRRMKKYGIQ